MKKSYSFTREGIKDFTNAAFDEALANFPPVIVSVGPHTIEIPMLPETFESMEILLRDTLDIYEEEYK